MQQQKTDAQMITQTVDRIVSEVEKVIVGKRKVVTRAVIALLCEGHVLLEDVPGLGKTMLARSIAAAVGGEFSRVQFTPDLLPTDITGAMVFDPRTAEFSYREGPVVTNILLADEINRAGPRTQSSLLEAMEERQVSVERHSVALPRPFFVIATQNPVELEAPSRCQKPSSIASSCASPLATRSLRMSVRCCDVSARTSRSSKCRRWLRPRK